ncbi:unnamed protein product [Brachionus calyciflorus]|uniref:DRBM domain-containing protein n=1 Tax=Brachionus calyciflorus TaxID=104777 RepID=A0A813VUP4_9BILA|nr:unnamed protein product [Brachionus calyciflorus]
MSILKTPLKKSDSITLSAVNAASLLFNESDSKSFRTPISLLQEICTKSVCPAPVYELLDAEGKIHQPIFVFKCSLNQEIQAIGKSSTKKKAKHLAALGVLNQVRLNNLGINDELANKLNDLINGLNNLDLEENPSTVLSKSLASEVLNAPVIPNNELDLSNIQVGSVENIDAIKESVIKCENPVGELIEIASRYSMRPPEFEYGDEEGPPHNRQFLCNVTFGNFKESALARTKKLAKKYAALRLLFRIKASGQFNKPINVTKTETNGYDQIHPKINGTKKFAANIFNQFKLSKNLAINLVLSSELEKVSSLHLLDQLAKEEKFEYEIYRIPTTTNAHVCALDLKTNPHLTYGGYGDTPEEAINKSVFYTLNHIRVMCSRGKQK